MSNETFEYVIQFTIAHEGDTPFMYNNWSAKNTKRDVTIGVGYALTSVPMEKLNDGTSTCKAGEREAASEAIRGMFRVVETGATANPTDMITEFRRVYNTERIGGNLFSAYRDKSPLEMDREAMLRLLREKMLGFWEQRGRDFPNFQTIPAQAQVALMSWNYGLRLRGAPHMCDAVLAGDYLTAAKETRVPGWDGQKNDAHRRLMLNAAAIMRNGGDRNKLPPMQGPFKPPPAEPGAETTLNTIPLGLPGRWTVTIGGWRGLFFFDQSGGVSWANHDHAPKHAGRWSVNGSRLEWKFRDPGDFRTFTAQLPLDPSGVSGTILPAGQGWFSMSKGSLGVA
jgi:hypothetical protein